ncbi:MAG: type II toxin-antitoxin system VapC family toxin [Okeania sp. SIO3I5]|uniref:type II toxin-antitoxin system VapC family toxin n=1 Tax=Okeania sp. SIO3I5 TaxID=2607805 RepID=UPI0013BA173F|nr:type II toxin-antitoxin system VapC family toxin [Okeania sp. SIO3I5]NEQ40630.1 type II toxin-antitoxin system VapC family toxin [Okeania sp. SIO3I5]
MAVIERLIVLDINVALYYLSGRLVNPLPNATYFVSVVTEIELLSYPNLTPVEEVQIRDFLAQIIVVDINYHIKELAIALRKSYRLKLPDAIVAATAQSQNAELFTNDTKLTNLTEINTKSVQIY